MQGVSCQLHALSVPAEKDNRLFHLFEVNPGIEAGAEGPFVGNTENRQRIGVDKPARKVALAGNRYDRFRTYFLHDLPRKRTARCNKKVELIGISDLYEILDLAPAAPFAVIDVMREADLTVIDLKAVGKKDEDLLCFFLLGPDQSVVHRNDCVLERLFFALQECSNEHEQRVHHLEDNAPRQPTDVQMPSLP